MLCLVAGPCLEDSRRAHLCFLHACTYDMGSWWSLLGFGGTKSATVATVGLDNAGKSTLLHRLATGSVAELPPTETASSRTFTAGNVRFKAWDLGGHESWRKLWETFVLGAHGVIFLVDSVAAERVDEARDELDGIFDVVAEQVLAGTAGAIPIAVLFNKRDLANALPVRWPPRRRCRSRAHCRTSHATLFAHRSLLLRTTLSLSLSALFSLLARSRSRLAAATADTDGCAC